MWHLRASYCPLCGTPLDQALVEGRERPCCSACDFVLFKNPASAAAAVVLDPACRVLLIRRRIPPYRGEWALPAGYQEIDEHPQETVVREVREETGIEIEVTGLHDVVYFPDDPRKPANVIVFLCRPVGGELKAGSDASEAAWFELDRLPEDIGFHNDTHILGPLRAKLEGQG